MIKDLLNNITNEIEAYLQEAGVADPAVVLERSAAPDFGEYSSNAAMRYAKELQKSPTEIAGNLTEFLNSKNIDGLDRAEWVKPGFVNLHFKLEVKVRHLQSIKDNEETFGVNQSHQGEKWVIEHTSPNPNKAMHIGHLRNNLTGMSLVKLLRAAGAEVASEAVYNDRGIAIAKAMYGFLAHMKKTAEVPTTVEHFSENPDDWYTPIEKEMKSDEFVAECYVKAEEDLKNNPQAEAFTRQLVVDWEAEDANVWKLWRHVLQYAYIGNELVLLRLGNHWDKVWYEHEHYKKGKDYVQQGLDKGIFQKLDDGAILTNLEEKYSLSDTILIKNDGTSLYITQDIALTDLKKQAYKADKLVWVIGPEQSLALKQMFAVCEQLGIGQLDDFTHVSYGRVSLKGKDGEAVKMSSRTGNVVMIDNLIDEVKTVVKARFDDEDKWEEKEREELAEKLSLAAVKFAFLRSDKNQDMLFDLAQSVDVHGDSGMYVMYTYVRTQSILRKADESSADLVLPEESGSEADLLRSLLYFEDVVQKAVNDMSVHHVAQYLLELSSEFNSWYAKETILDESEEQTYKLLIVEAVAVTIKRGFDLLGVEVVKEM